MGEKKLNSHEIQAEKGLVFFSVGKNQTFLEKLMKTVLLGSLHNQRTETILIVS